MAPNNWHPLLKKVFLFSAFTESQLNLLAKRMKLLSLPKGALLFQENEPGEGMFLVLSGTIKLQKTNPADPDQILTVGFLNRGDAAGEMSLLVGDNNVLTAVVDSTAEVLKLSKIDFDHLLNKHPHLAVHLSRVLSNRLATLDVGQNKSTQGKVFALVPALPTRDQVVFSLNLGLSMVEQTRRRVLLIVVNQASHLWAKALGLDPIPVTNEMIERGCFDERRQFEKLVMVHPSGLEVAVLEESTLYDYTGKFRFSLLPLIQDNYDYCLLFLPPRFEDPTVNFLKTVARVSTVAGPHSHPADIEEIRKINQALQPEKSLEKIWLTGGTGYIPRDFYPDARIPWDFDWGKQFLITGSPQIPPYARMTHRMLDRLARSYGSLLVGIAIGSGATFGYAAIGILKVLEREGIYPDVIAGTSMGALLGAFYAAGKSPEELEAIAKTITRFRVFFKLADFTFPHQGLIKGNAILNFLRSHLGDITFQELNLPFSCVSTDVLTGKEIIMDQGNVAEAVRASLSLPFFFNPFYKDGRYLVDGGLVNPVPTSVIVAMGANILLSANMTLNTASRKVPHILGWRARIPIGLRGPSIMEILMKTIYTMQYEISVTRSNLADVVININAPDLLWWDLDKANTVIRLGEAAAEENLSKIKSLLPFYSDHCKVTLSVRRRKAA